MGEGWNKILLHAVRNRGKCWYPQAIFYVTRETSRECPHHFCRNSKNPGWRKASFMTPPPAREAEPGVREEIPTAHEMEGPGVTPADHSQGSHFGWIPCFLRSRPRATGCIGRPGRKFTNCHILLLLLSFFIWNWLSNSVGGLDGYKRVITKQPRPKLIWTNLR